MNDIKEYCPMKEEKTCQSNLQRSKIENDLDVNINTEYKRKKFIKEIKDKNIKTVEFLNFYDKIKIYQNLHEDTLLKLCSTHEIFKESKYNYSNNKKKKISN